MLYSIEWPDGRTQDVLRELAEHETGSFLEMWMDPKLFIQSEVRERKKVSYVNTCVWNAGKLYRGTYFMAGIEIKNGHVYMG